MITDSIAIPINQHKKNVLGNHKVKDMSITKHKLKKGFHFDYLGQL